MNARWCFSCIEYEMQCTLHSFHNVRERKYSLELLPSKTKIQMILKFHPSDIPNALTHTLPIPSESVFTLLFSLFLNLLTGNSGKTYHLEGRVSSLWTHRQMQSLQSCAKWWVVLVRSEYVWECQMYKEKRVYWFVSAGLGGTVHVLHRVESYLERFAKQSVGAVSVFRRRKSDILVHTTTNIISTHTFKAAQLCRGQHTHHAFSLIQLKRHTHFKILMAWVFQRLKVKQKKLCG